MSADETLSPADVDRQYIACIDLLNASINELFLRDERARFSFNLGLVYERRLSDSPHLKEAREAYEAAVAYGSVNAALNLAGLYSEEGSELFDRQKAFQLTLLAAERGQVVAMTDLITLYEKGLGTPISRESAKQWAAAAAENGVDYAACWLAGVNLSDAQLAASAIETLQGHRNSDEPSCWMRLGSAYISGEHIEADYAQGRQLLQDAYNEGQWAAAPILGRMYELGLGVPKDLAKAEEIYREEYKRSPESAGKTLGLFLKSTLTGNETSRSKKVREAAELLKFAADAGDPEAALGYADLILSGLVRSASEVDAIRYFGVAAISGDLVAKFKRGRLTTSKRGDEGWQDVKAAADGGLADAAYFLAKSCSTADVLPPDDQCIFRYLKIAADGGNSDAAFEYAQRLVERSPAGAAEYFEVAHNLGHNSAGLEAGRVLILDKTRAADVQRGLLYLEIAIKNGSSEARWLLGKHLINSGPTATDLERAVLLLEEAANSGVIDAAFELGVYYSTGPQPDYAIARDGMIRAYYADYPGAEIEYRRIINAQLGSDPANRLRHD